jgi:hypothetical protein
MSDTPRTDQYAFKAAFLPPQAIVTADFARKLEREVARLTAEVADLKAHDPLAEMWRELAEYQPQADRDGHGESWARMCSERTAAAARSAAWYAADAASSAADAADAASSAADAARDVKGDAACAVAEIRRAKEER